MQWGLGAVIVIGALVGAVMIPTSKKAEEVADARPRGHSRLGARSDER